jgi:hypothetical protein
MVELELALVELQHQDKDLMVELQILDHWAVVVAEQVKLEILMAQVLVVMAF